ncbi:uncharacterized protein LOC128230066 [Mya arenaria]|uniref:uncharacterized protein LOC128230066 n=1 Tax=Mya arenaria TaxID=6604 RepID=UPI0022E23019|nr:uncharacterized protein LOC128230066 [Mya arenaria]
MMKILLLVGVVLLEGSFAKPCCMPDQWSAVTVDTVGEYNRDLDSASLLYGSRTYYHDNNASAIAYFEVSDNTTAHKHVSKHVIKNFKQMKMYTIVGKTCTTEDLQNKMPPACIPDDATSFGHHMYPGGVSVDTWFWKDSSSGASVRLGVSSDRCLPITESNLSSGPDYILRTSLYQNVTTGIRDPMAFFVPTFCT